MAENGNFSLSFVGSDEESFCSPMVDSVYSVEYPNTTAICIEVVYAPPVVRNVNLNVTVVTSDDIELNSYHVSWLFHNSNGFNNHIFSFPFLPPDNFTGQANIYANATAVDYDGTSDEIRILDDNSFSSIAIGEATYSASISPLTDSSERIIPAGGVDYYPVEIINNGDFSGRFIIQSHLNSTLIGSVEKSVPAGFSGQVSVPMIIPLNFSEGDYFADISVLSPASIVLNSVQTSIEVIEAFASLNVTSLSLSADEILRPDWQINQGERVILSGMLENSGSLDFVGTPVISGSNGSNYWNFTRESNEVILVSGPSTLDWEEAFYVPFNTSLGLTQFTLSWVNESVDVDDYVYSELLVSPPPAYGNLILDETSDGSKLGFTVHNSGQVSKDYHVSWILSGGDEKVDQGSKAMGIIEPGTNVSSLVDIGQGHCLVGAWTVDMNLMNGVNGQILDSIHGFQFLNSSTPNGWLDVLSGGLSQNKVFPGDLFSVELSLSSSSHNCDSFDSPVVIHLVPLDEGQPFVHEERISLGSEESKLHTTSVNIPVTMESGNYSVVVQTFRVVNDIIIEHQAIEIGDLFIENPIRSLSLDCDNALPEEPVESLPINCQVTNSGTSVQIVRLEASLNGNSVLSPPFEVGIDGMNLGEVIASGPDWGVNEYIVNLLTLVNGQWEPFDNQSFELTLTNPFANVEPLREPVLYPYPPSSGAETFVTITSQGKDVERSGEIELLIINSVGSVSVLANIPHQWDSGQIISDTVQFNWPSDCEDYTIKAILKDNHGEEIESSSIKSWGCDHVDRPDFRFDKVNFDKDTGELNFTVINRGNSESIETTTSVYVDGYEWEFENILNPLSPEATQNFKIDFGPDSTMIGSISIEIDSGNRVNELMEGADNHHTIGIDSGLKQLTFAEDSDGDGLKDEIEEQGWHVYAIHSRQGYDCVFEEMEAESPNMNRCVIDTGRMRARTDRIDTDGDGLSDLFEYENRLNPEDVDTDGDGYSDWIEVSDEEMDPHVVEFDSPEIEALAASSSYSDDGTSGRGVLDLFNYEHITRDFEVRDMNLDKNDVFVHIIRDGEVHRIIEPTLISQEEHIMRFRVSFDSTLADELHGYKVMVNASDKFGNFQELEIGNQSSLGKRVVAGIYDSANKLFPGLGDIVTAQIAMAYGFAMGIYSGFKDIISLIVSLPGLLWTVTKFLVKGFIELVTNGAEAVESALSSLWSVLSSIYSWLSENYSTIPGIVEKAFEKGRKSSIFSMSSIAYGSYLLAYVAGFLFIEIAMIALTMGVLGTAITSVKALKTGDKVNSMRTFMSKATSSVKSQVDDYSRVLNKVKSLKNIGKRIDYSDLDKGTKIFWKQAIKIKERGFIDENGVHLVGNHNAFLKWCDENSIKRLSQNPKKNRGTFWAHQHFLAENMDLLTAKQMKGFAKEFTRGDYNRAIRSNPDEFSRAMSNMGKKIAEKGDRGELRRIDSGCRNILPFPGGELDKLCRVVDPDGTIRFVDREVKTVANPIGATYKMADLVPDKTHYKYTGKEKFMPNSNYRQDGINTLIKHLDSTDDPLKTFVDLACKGHPSISCAADAADDYNALRNAHRVGKIDFEYEFVDNTPHADYKDIDNWHKQRGCLKIQWGSKSCKDLLDESIQETDPRHNNPENRAKRIDAIKNAKFFDESKVESLDKLADLWDGLGYEALNSEITLYKFSPEDIEDTKAGLNIIIGILIMVALGIVVATRQRKDDKLVV
jgi:hypothetical protein